MDANGAAKYDLGGRSEGSGFIQGWGGTSEKTARREGEPRSAQARLHATTERERDLCARVRSKKDRQWPRKAEPSLAAVQPCPLPASTPHALPRCSS